MRKGQFRQQTLVVKFAAAIFAICAVLLIVSLVTTGWLAEKQVSLRGNCHYKNAIAGTTPPLRVQQQAATVRV